ncbi:diguanylate cyclase domain-containing protein [Cellulomonas aerilata]|uniref:diguanylate cyclase domain-containing protein n=1 Tax=Cellulomonas aerilata TaxID=515326 RepID=UPI003CD08752
MNRAALEAQAGREVIRATRHHRSVAMLFLDIDRFERVDDSHGHTVGDECLMHAPGLCEGACARLTSRPGAAVMSHRAAD